jgi:hypothetical protein
LLLCIWRGSVVFCAKEKAWRGMDLIDMLSSRMDCWAT